MILACQNIASTESIIAIYLVDRWVTKENIIILVIFLGHPEVVERASSSTMVGWRAPRAESTCK